MLIHEDGITAPTASLGRSQAVMCVPRPGGWGCPDGATWDAVRRAVDRGAPPGAYLLAGSVSQRVGDDLIDSIDDPLQVRAHALSIQLRSPILDRFAAY